jgi:CcmD family protein
MNGFGYLILAYSLIWAALAFYLLLLGRRLERIGREVEELRRRAGDDPGPHRVAD